MCGFKPGDEVVCVDATPRDERPIGIAKGAIYTIATIYRHFDEVGVTLAELPVPGDAPGWLASRFRKVERKSDSLSIEAFRTIKDGAYEEPRRANQPAKRKEQA